MHVVGVEVPHIVDTPRRIDLPVDQCRELLYLRLQICQQSLDLNFLVEHYRTAYLQEHVLEHFCMMGELERIHIIDVLFPQMWILVQGLQTGHELVFVGDLGVVESTVEDEY